MLKRNKQPYFGYRRQQPENEHHVLKRKKQLKAFSNEIAPNPIIIFEREKGL
jgi:hypothetical protein